MQLTSSPTESLVTASTHFRAALPEPREPHVLDVLSGLGLIALTILALVPPPTTTVRVFRAALAPLICFGWMYLSYVPLLSTPKERWGAGILFVMFSFRTSEMLVMTPPEHSVWRVRNGVPEPIPEPYTLRKLDWANSLVWSWRGVGWSFSAPLCASQLKVTRESSRKKYIIRRSINGAVAYSLDDASGALMRRAAPDFFITNQIKYYDLSQLERGMYSTMVVVRTVCILEFSHVAASLVFVSLGAWLGDHELSSPWGWPPMFASLREIFSHPGIGYLWARAWQQYNRRMLHVWGWVLIGEKSLGLPVSGVASLASKAQPPQAKVLEAVTVMNDQDKKELSGTVDQGGDDASATSRKRKTTLLEVSEPDTAPATPVSGRVSPSNPSPKPTKEKKTPDVAANSIKSAITFTLSGSHHDCSSLLSSLDKMGRGEKELPLGLMVTPFFMIQPLGLVVEAIVKRRWRSVRKTLPSPETASRVIEFVIGNTWTWVWLGWTARWYVRCSSEIGAYQPFPNKPIFSITELAWDYFHDVVVGTPGASGANATMGPAPVAPVAPFQAV